MSISLALAVTAVPPVGLTAQGSGKPPTEAPSGVLCAQSPPIDADLQAIIDARATLPEAIRKAIMALIEESVTVGGLPGHFVQRNLSATMSFALPGESPVS